MKTKIGYLNFILTVIAVALITIILQNVDIIPKAHAASSFYGLQLNEKGELPVKVMNSDMDVRVTNTVDMNIDEVGGHSVHYEVPVHQQ